MVIIQASARSDLGSIFDCMLVNEKESGIFQPVANLHLAPRLIVKLNLAGKGVPKSSLRTRKMYKLIGLCEVSLVGVADHENQMCLLWCLERM